MSILKRIFDASRDGSVSAALFYKSLLWATISLLLPHVDFAIQSNMVLTNTLLTKNRL